MDQVESADVTQTASSALKSTSRGTALRLTLSLTAATLSGCAALIYQINWQRDLGLVVGVSHYATTAVILAFFVGFALGGWLAHTFVDRTRYPWTILVVLELCVAIYAPFSHYFFDLAKMAVVFFAPDPSQPTASLVLIRAVVASFVVLIPATCMGATLPAFYRAVTLSWSDLGNRVGLMGGFNTAGAVLGAVLTTFVLMGNMERTSQIWLGAFFNLASATIALFLAGTDRDRAASTDEGEATPARPELGSEPVNARFVAALALSGMASLGLEVAWNRLVYLSLDHTIYTFALTLAVYLAGFSGGLLMAAFAARRGWANETWIAACYAAAVLSTISGLYLFSNGFHVADVREALGYFSGAVLIATAILFLPSFFLGCAFAPTVTFVTRDFANVGRDTGLAHFANNLGSIFSIIVVGFVLLPYVSLTWVMVFCLAPLAAAGVLMTPVRATWSERPTAYRAVLGVVATLVVFSIPWNLYAGHTDKFYSEVVTLREDASGVWGLDRTRPNHYVLRLNGYYENHVRFPPSATVQADYLIPALFVDDIKKVYMSGMGLGIGAAEVLRMKEVERFDAAEISPKAIHIAEEVWAQEPNANFFEDPRFRLIEEDARIFLESTREKYDVVISGTNRIFYAGSTNLYSIEYWRMVREHLRPGGVLLQWLPLYSSFSAKSLVATFREVFPNAPIIGFGSYVYMIGFSDTPMVSIERFRSGFRRAPRLRTAFRSPEHAFASVVAIGEVNAPLNRDALPVCEYSFRGFEAREHQFAAIFGEPRPWTAEGPPPSVRPAQESSGWN